MAAPNSCGAASRPSETPIPIVTIDRVARATLASQSSRPERVQIASVTSLPPVGRRPSTRNPTTTIAAAPISATIRRQPGDCLTIDSSVGP